MTRAAHLVLDDDPKLFQDHLALGLSGVENEAALRTALKTLQAEVAQRATPELAQAFFRYARADTTMRQRYTEDELGKAVARGVAQRRPCSSSLVGAVTLALSVLTRRTTRDTTRRVLAHGPIDRAHRLVGRYRISHRRTFAHVREST